MRRKTRREFRSISGRELLRTEFFTDQASEKEIQARKPRLQRLTPAMNGQNNKLLLDGQF
jgi:hypothetical protein